MNRVHSIWKRKPKNSLKIVDLKLIFVNEITSKVFDFV